MAKEYREEIHIPIQNNQSLTGDLVVPNNAVGLVIFAHGSGSSRLSPRNRYVAQNLNQNNLATFLFDLLTVDEEVIDNQTRELRFNIPLLAERLIQATRWIKHQTHLQNYHFGYFGSSTGAGAALIAAAQLPEAIYAVVSRGGRPDLADAYLPKVKAPTLLIVGGLDYTVIQLNQQAQQKMQAVTELAIVENATHLFEEPGTLAEVTRLASDWFRKYLS